MMAMIDAWNAKAAAKSRRNGVSCRFDGRTVGRHGGQGGLGRLIRELNDLDPKTSRYYPDRPPIRGGAFKVDIYPDLDFLTP